MYVPKTDHELEPELAPPPPRPIPESIAHGPHARRQRAAMLGFAACAIACLALSTAPFIDVLALYVLPLAYLEWIGFGALLIAAFLLGAEELKLGPYKYLRHGIPVVAQVVGLVKAPSAVINGQANQHAFTASLEMLHPDTGEEILANVKSNDFSSSQKDRYEAPFKVGDSVTALYLPGRFEKSLRLYAFLDLSPDLQLRRGAAKEQPVWMAAVVVLTVVALFAMLFGNVYAFGRYHPIDFDYWLGAPAMLAGALVLGVGFLVFLSVTHRREQRQLVARAERALEDGTALEIGTPFMGSGIQGWFLRIVIAVGAPFLGALTALCWAFLANAVLDESAARPVPATVTEMTMTTHAFVFREYELEYRLEGTEEDHKLLTTPEHLMTFEGDAVIAQLRAGRFGWAWVEDVEPAGADPAGGGEDGDVPTPSPAVPEQPPGEPE